jgi:acyl carrier protein
MTMKLDVSQCLDTITGLLRQRPHLEAGAKLDADAVLDDLGIDSLDLMVIFSCFEESFGVGFDNEEIDPEIYPTLGDLAAFFASRVGEGSPDVGR